MHSSDATVVAVALGVLMLTWPVAAFAMLPSDVSSFDATGLTVGPSITDAGLAWENSEGIVLTNSAGRSTVLASTDAPNWDNFVDLAWFGRDWWAVARPSGVLAGRIGGPLHALALLRKCNPGSKSIKPGVRMTQYAISGEHLYAALPKGCLAHRVAPFGEVVDLDLRTRHWRVLTAMPGPLDYLAASGRYLALAYWRTSHSTAENHLLVRVLDAATGTLVNRITPPPTSGARSNSTSGIQVDGHGDVLVTEGCCGVSPGQLAQVAQPARKEGWWWARARSTVGQEIHLGSDAVLSDGQVAFFPTDVSNPGGMRIDVKNLLAPTTRTIVAFSGSISAEGLALSGNELAWSQQSTVLNVVRGQTADGGSFEECKDIPLGPIELASLNLRDIPSSPVVVSGVPIPAQYANEPACIIRAAAATLATTASRHTATP